MSASTKPLSIVSFRIAQIVFFVAFYFICLNTFAQSKQTLEKKKTELEKNIRFTNTLLNETKKNKEASLNQLGAINAKIKLRQQLISTINREVNYLNKQIEKNQGIVFALESDLIKIKKEYAKMLYYAYKNRASYSQLMFIFSSADFNQALKRLKYLEDYGDFRQEQVKVIKETKIVIDKKTVILEEKRSEKRELLESKKDERASLASERSEKNSIYKKLQNKESTLRADLKKKRKNAIKLQKAIEDIIAEELRKAREEAKKAKGFALTPEESKLSNNFKNNKGRLPWPTKRGIVTGHFGEHNHPVLAGIKINNNGIDISTNKGATARAIFGGTVTGVILLPGGSKKAVIVKHGNYFTVYGNLIDVIVTKGDKVNIKEELGTIYTESKKFKTEGHLEIWKASENGTTKLNPEEWIIQGLKGN